MAKSKTIVQSGFGAPRRASRMHAKFTNDRNRKERDTEQQGQHPKTAFNLVGMDA